MRPLVILRPEPGSSATAGAARRLGLEVVTMPLFSVEPVKWKAPDPAEHDGLLLSSANAIRHGGEELDHLRSLPAHCVGDSTAAAARDAGFSLGRVGNGGIDALLESLPPDHKLLHLCGADRHHPNEPRQTIRDIPVYRATKLPNPSGFEKIGVCVVAVHSGRAAARFAELTDRSGLARERIAIAAISDEAAAAAGDGWADVKTVAEPNDTALLALAASLCNNSS